MNLYAYTQISTLEDYVNKHYGKPPRLRGIQLMKVETPEEPEPCDGYQEEVFNKYCGQDVVYIHTRCGGGNYEYFGADKWEERNSDTFLEGVGDEFDCTYRDHYFKAVVDDEYRKLVDKYSEQADGQEND